MTLTWPLKVGSLKDPVYDSSSRQEYSTLSSEVL